MCLIISLRIKNLTFNCSAALSIQLWDDPLPGSVPDGLVSALIFKQTFKQITYQRNQNPEWPMGVKTNQILQPDPSQ